LPALFTVASNSKSLLCRWHGAIKFVLFSFLEPRPSDWETDRDGGVVMAFIFFCEAYLSIVVWLFFFRIFFFVFWVAFVVLGFDLFAGCL
jgi:hypothetical protein